MFEFKYIRDIYSQLSGKLLDSDMAINATINIKGESVVHDSIQYGVTDNIDGRADPIHSSRPLDLPKYVRLKVFPIERNVTKFENNRTTYDIAGRFEPFDRWITCWLSDIAIREEMTYLDFAESIIIETNIYRVRGQYREDFGTKPILHIFLVKEDEHG